jgi:peptidyl-dipeptidase Dcp
VASAAACTTSPPAERPQSPVAPSARSDEKPEPAMNDNVLLGPWSGPYGGVPAFDRMDVDALKPALEAGMEMQLEEMDAIASNPAPPTFENTIVAMEDAGRDLDRVLTYFGIWSSNRSTPEFRAVQAEMAPVLADFRTRITQNRRLFERVKAVYDGLSSSGLRPDQRRLAWLVYDGFARNGATLEGAKKERYATIDKRLAELYTSFANNVLADEEGYVLFVTRDRTGGLPASFLAAAASAAKDRGHEGEYAITNTRSSMDPFLTSRPSARSARESGAPTTRAATTVTSTTTTRSSPRS